MTQNNDGKWAVIVHVGGWKTNMYTPFVAHVTRDRPRTLFTKARGFGGENRHDKFQIRYKFFDTEEQARDVCKSLHVLWGTDVRDAALQEWKDKTDAARENAKAALAVPSAGWLS